MLKSYVCLVIMLFVCAWGCTKERDKQSDAASSTSQPADAAFAGSMQSKGPRKYQAMPDSLLSPPPPAVARAFSEWALVQQELAKGSLDEAIHAYERIKDGFPAEQRLCSITALQLSDVLLNTTPVDLDRVRRLLKTLEDNVGSWGGDKRLKLDYDRQCLLADLADARRVMALGESEFKEWLGLVVGKAESLGESVAIERDILRMVNYVLGPASRNDGAVVERLEALLVGLQAGFAWRSPSVLRSLQECRVQLLFDSKQPVESLHEARTLLALSSQDAKEWIVAYGRIPKLMQAAGRDEKDVARFTAYQRHGINGPDGHKGTDDDILDPLADVKRDAAKAWDLVGDFDKRRETAKPQETVCEQGIRAGVGMLLAGRGSDARGSFGRLCQAAVATSTRHAELALKYLAMTQAYCDGHLLGCDKCIADVVAVVGKAESNASKMWRYEAIMFLKQREVLAGRLIDEGCIEPALGLCRAIAENDSVPERLEAAINHAWRACMMREKSGKVDVAIPGFMDFGKSLNTPRARIIHAQLATAKYKEIGDEASVLPAIESLNDIWEQAGNEPGLVLLRASSLIRLGRSSEALPELKRLVQRSDLSPENSWRSQLLLGVAYVQEGQLVESREVLQRLLDEKPSTEYRDKVVTVLSNIPM